MIHSIAFVSASLFWIEHDMLSYIISYVLTVSIVVVSWLLTQISFASINFTGWAVITEHRDTYLDAITAEAMKALRYNMWTSRQIL